jgi:hypothetical protein
MSAFEVLCFWYAAALLLWAASFLILNRRHR